MSRKDFKYRGTKCINCETALDVSEKYCHYCGQLNSTKKLTIRDFIEEFFANFYAYDSRLRNSIVSIFTKPGVLAREFNEGKRHTYANPFRLFLSVSLVLFITYNFTESDEESFNDDKNQEIAKEQLKNEIKKDSALTKIVKSNYELENIINYEWTTYSKDSIYTKEFIDQKIKSDLDPFSYYIITLRNFHLKYPKKSSEQALKELKFENTLFFRVMYNKAKLFKSNNIYEELWEYFYQKLPFLIFLSLPILTLMFWLVFYSRRINYTEHLVFTYTFFTFVFLGMLIFNLISFVSSFLSSFIAGISFAFLFPIYFYKSLRNFYQQSRWITVLKFLILNPLFFLFLSICALIMMLIGVILF